MYWKISFGLVIFICVCTQRIDSVLILSALFFCPCFLTDTSIAILNLLLALLVKSTCYNAALLDVGKQVRFCFLLIVFVLKENQLIWLQIEMCNFRQKKSFKRSCLLGLQWCSRFTDKMIKRLGGYFIYVSKAKAKLRVTILISV